MVRRTSILAALLVFGLAFTALAQEAAKSEAPSPAAPAASPEAAPSAASAAPQPAPMPAEEGLANFEAVYGEVKSVDAVGRSITLETYDYEQEKEVTVTYNVKPDAEFEEVKDLSEINAGDWVDLELEKDEAGNMVVTFVAVEKEPIEDIVEEEAAE